MTKQPSLFDTATILEPTKLPPTDPNVQPEDRERLAGQCAAILAALRDGPKTNAELAGISLKYTSRLSDLRKHGFTITASRLEGGTFLYRLHA